jgi:predicted alpha/beta-fold hydrolase
MRDFFSSIKASLPPCVPPWWAASGHLQTILGHLLPSPSIKAELKVHHIGLASSQDQIHSSYLAGSKNVVVYLFHGLGGSADAAYMQRTALICQRLGYHVFLNNHRGCGQGVGLATEPYHSGRSEDLSEVIGYGRRLFPGHLHLAVGFSLSANALLLLCAGVRAKALPDGAIAVNGPIHLDRASIKLTQGLNLIYDQRFVLELKRYVKENLPQGLERLQSVTTLRDFDELYTAPIGGFKNRADYYQRCSAKPQLKNIQLPVVLLTAKDDPFVSPEDYVEAELSDHVLLHLEESGGHMGYLMQQERGFQRWLDISLEAYLKGLVEFKS